MSQAVALPYAKAAFEYAEKQKQLLVWSRALNALSVVFDDPKVCRVLKNPAIDQIAVGKAIFEEIFQLFADEGLKNFIHLLASNQRLLIIPEIFQQFEKYRIAYEKVTPVKIISANEILPEQKEKLTKALKIRTQCDVRLEFVQDPRVIGGVIIEIDDEVIDASVSNTLSRMLKSLIQA